MIPKIYLQMVGSRIAWLWDGSPLMTVGSGGSVAKAKAAKVSIIKLIHKSWTPESGDSTKKIEPINTVNNTERFTVT